MKSLFSISASISVPSRIVKLYIAIFGAVIILLYLLLGSICSLLAIGLALTGFVLMDSLFEMKNNPPTIFSKKLFGFFSCTSAAIASVILIFLFIKYLLSGTIIA